MKDYSLNLDEQKKYILSYTIEGEKIIIKLASEEFYIIPYTEENEQSVIQKMESQARKAEIEPGTLETILSVILPLAVSSAFGDYINKGGLLSAMKFVIIAMGAIAYPIRCIIRAIKQREIRKMHYFLNYQQELSDIDGNNENMLLNVSQKTVSQIKAQQAKGKQPFTINNIDSYSFRDLKTLEENYERVSSFGFDEDGSELGEAESVLKRTLNPKHLKK